MSVEQTQLNTHPNSQGGLKGWLRRRLRRTTRLNLALQGGGAHGAFTWGVLDRLLEEDTIELEGISGASAGAINGAVLASGWIRGGREGAREALLRFWRKISEGASLGPMHPNALDYLISGWRRELSPGYILMSALTKVASPYQFNPAGFNPLINILKQEIDFDALRASRELKLFIAVTNVHSGKLRLIRNAELSPQALAASACIPVLFQAVELNREHYWDGGYSANPALYPLVFECRARDMLLVQLTPSWREKVPQGVADIIDRSNEIAFNSNLLRELQILAMLGRSKHRLPMPAGLWRRGYRRLHLHHIGTAERMERLGRASRVNTEWRFLLSLRDMGREQAQAWLAEHAHKLGRRSSTDLQEYL